MVNFKYVQICKEISSFSTLLIIKERHEFLARVSFNFFAGEEAVAFFSRFTTVFLTRFRFLAGTTELKIN